MEHQLWKEIVAVLAQADKRPKSISEIYGDEQIVKVWLWSVLHDRPICWACNQQNWPPHERRWKKPSNSRMSRRLRTPSVKQLLQQMEQQVLRPRDQHLMWIMDGKPLVISGCSKDRQAGYGRATGGKAKGYKIHAIVAAEGAVAAWRLAPMNKDERVMAARMIPTAAIQGYLLADANYDSNPLHEVCEQKGNLQLVTPRRYGSGRGHGHRQQTRGRMRSKALLENPMAHFGTTLYEQRDHIERYFGRLSNWGGGLTHLPPWARTYRRVHRWVQAKLLLTALRHRIRTKTYAA